METPDPQPPRDQPGLWRRWPRLLILAGAFLLLFCNLAWQGFIYSASQEVFLSVWGGAVLGVLLPLFAWSRRLGIDRVRDLALDRPRPAVLLAAALLAVAALVPTSLLAELSLRLHPVDPRWAEALAESMPRNWYGWLLAGSATVLAAPLVEEILFRGFIHRAASLTWGAVPAALLSSLLFAVIHSEPWYVFGLVGVGLLLAFVFEATGSVTTCVVTHGFYNGISLWLIANAGGDYAKETPITTGQIGWAALSLAVLVLVGGWLRKHAGRQGRGAPKTGNQEPF